MVKRNQWTGGVLLHGGSALLSVFLILLYSEKVDHPMKG